MCADLVLVSINLSSFYSKTSSMFYGFDPFISSTVLNEIYCLKLKTIMECNTFNNNSDEFQQYLSLYSL